MIQEIVSKSKLYLWLIHIVISTLHVPRTNWTYYLMLHITNTNTKYTLKYTRAACSLFIDHRLAIHHISASNPRMLCAASCHGNGRK